MTLTADLPTTDLPATYDGYLATQQAIWEGRATELWPCVQCLPLPHRLTLGAEQVAPLRGNVGSHIAGSDPTEVIHLSCGHHLF